MFTYRDDQKECKKVSKAQNHALYGLPKHGAAFCSVIIGKHVKKVDLGIKA